MQWNHTLGARLQMRWTWFSRYHVILLRGHISSWSKMMHKVLVQHSFPIARIHLLFSTVQGGDGTGWLREGECAQRLYEAAWAEMETHSSHYASSKSLLLWPLHSSGWINWDSPKSNESKLEKYSTYFKTAPRSASLSLASPGSSPVQGITSASVYLNTRD